MRAFREATTDTEFANAIAGDAMWDVLYHEQSLQAAHKQLGHAIACMARVSGVNFTVEEAYKFYSADDDEDDAESSPMDWFRTKVGGAVWSVKHHEEELAQSHEGLACAKAFLMRGKYEVDWAEIEKKTAARLGPKP
jgi:hypothetical protein